MGREIGGTEVRVCSKRLWRYVSNVPSVGGGAAVPVATVVGPLLLRGPEVWAWSGSTTIEISRVDLVFARLIPHGAAAQVYVQVT